MSDRYNTRTVIYDERWPYSRRMMVRVMASTAEEAKEICRRRFNGRPLRCLDRGECRPPAILNRPEPFNKS